MARHDDQLVDAALCSTEFEAEALAEVLRAAGVAAAVLGGTLAGFRAEAPGAVRVVVRRGDLDRARSVLAERRMPQSELEAEALAAGEVSLWRDESGGIPVGATGRPVPTRRGLWTLAIVGLVLGGIVLAIASRELVLGPNGAAVAGATVLAGLVVIAWLAITGAPKPPQGPEL